MKTKILFLLLTFFVLQSFAQHDYVPMAVENAQWIYYNDDDDDLPPWIDYYFGYKIQGDIEIEGVWYKKVYYRNYVPVTKDDNSTLSSLRSVNEFLIGAIRDDVPNRKVYGVLFQYPLKLIFKIVI